MRPRAPVALIIGALAACSPSTSPTSAAGRVEPAQPKILLGSYRVHVDPSNPRVFAFEPLAEGARDLPPGLGRVQQALANGNETVELGFQSQFAVQNCAPGVCGCDGAQGDLPVWATGDCTAEGYVDYGIGRVVVNNTTDDKTFVDPAVVLTNLNPPGVAVFSQVPSTSGSCSSYGPTRFTSPHNGSYYLRYNDIAPGGCHKGVDSWIVAANQPGVSFTFDVHLLVHALDVDPLFDEAIFDEPVPRPPRPEQRTPGLSSATTAGLTCTGVVAGSSVLCVETGGSGNGTAAAPFGTIQAAVNAAKSGDVIQIAQGNYSESVSVYCKSLAFRGGFAGSGDFSSSIPAERVTSILGPSNNSCIDLDIGPWDCDHTVEITGLRLAGAGGKPEGGGIYVQGGTARIEHNLIENNDTGTSSWGGGVFATDCNLELHYNVIRNNEQGKGAVTAFGEGISASVGAIDVIGNEIADNTSHDDHGGGLYVSARDVEILGNLITGNVIGQSVGYGWGGGVIVEGDPSDPGVAVLAYNVVTGNSAPDSGSGVFIDEGARALLINELIYGNVCPSYPGAGLYVDGATISTGSAVFVVNSTIANHSCSPALAGSAIFLEQGSAVKLRNSILWGNGGSSEIVVDGSSALRASYTLSADLLSGAGNLSTDPAFASPGSGDFHLKSTVGRWVSTGPGAGHWTTDGSDSVGIDSGKPSDPVGSETAPNGGLVNLGAYGATVEASRSP